MPGGGGGGVITGWPDAAGSAINISFMQDDTRYDKLDVEQYFYCKIFFHFFI